MAGRATLRKAGPCHPEAAHGGLGQRPHCCGSLPKTPPRSRAEGQEGQGRLGTHVLSGSWCALSGPQLCLLKGS